MKKIPKKVIFCAVFCLIIVVTIIIFSGYKREIKNDEVINNNSNTFIDENVAHINQDISYNNLFISDFEIEKMNINSCEIRATVENSTENLIEMQEIILKLYDDNGNLLDVIGAQIDSIDAYGTTTLYARLMSKNISKICKIEIESN